MNNYAKILHLKRVFKTIGVFYKTFTKPRQNPQKTALKPYQILILYIGHIQGHKKTPFIHIKGAAIESDSML